MRHECRISMRKVRWYETSLRRPSAKQVVNRHLFGGAFDSCTVGVLVSRWLRYLWMSARAHLFETFGPQYSIGSRCGIEVRPPLYRLVHARHRGSMTL
jgi:hypothetical protein